MGPRTANAKLTNPDACASCAKEACRQSKILDQNVTQGMRRWPFGGRDECGHGASDDGSGTAWVYQSCGCGSCVERVGWQLLDAGHETERQAATASTGRSALEAAPALTRASNSPVTTISSPTNSSTPLKTTRPSATAPPHSKRTARTSLRRMIRDEDLTRFPERRSRGMERCLGGPLRVEGAQYASNHPASLQPPRHSHSAATTRARVSSEVVIESRGQHQLPTGPPSKSPSSCAQLQPTAHRP
jgi:hypothetical protein